MLLFKTRFYDLWQIQFNILPQISHTFYGTKRNNEVLFLLIWLFEILNIAFYDVMGSMANKSTMFSKQSLIRLYKLENKGFVQCGQAFFLCFATDLPHLLCESIQDRYNLGSIISTVVLPTTEIIESL